jgi:hypothetical protein
LDHLCAALANVEKHLHPRGLFLFDYVSREAFETMWESNEEIDAEDGRGTVRYAYDRNTRRATCFIDHQRTAIRQISLEREQVYQALHYAGLAVVREAPMSGPAPIRGRRLILAGKAHRGETA